MGHPLDYFKGISSSYVFPTSGNTIEDYGDTYDDDANFADLILNIIQREVKDDAFTWKIASILAKKLNITDKLRDHKLTYEELETEMKNIRSDLHGE